MENESIFGPDDYSDEQLEAFWLAAQLEDAQRRDQEQSEHEAAIEAEEQRLAILEANRESQCRMLADKLKLFRTTKELFAAGESTVKWLVPGFVPAESLISFQGRAKSGKSTFVFHMLKALTEGGEFLGQKLDPVKVVYLSEQSRPAFKQQLQEAGLTPNKNLFALTVEDNHGLNWENTFQLALLKMWKVGAQLLVVDSWGRFASFDHGEDEMAPAPTQRRISYLRGLMADTGASVLIIQHVSKDKTRGLIDSGMGSSALAQQVDLCLSLSGEPAMREIKSNRMPNERCRAVQGKGRFSEAIGEAICVELDGTTYRRVDFVQSQGTKDNAMTFLEAALSDGPKQSSQLETDAAAEGIGRTRLFEAKKELGIRATKEGKSWIWTLPE